MPVYEYECRACHREFEYQQRMADPDKTVCEACGGALERLISRTAFQLKGSGWYKDLYSSSKPEPKSSDASDAKSGDAKSGDAQSGDASSSDAKSESKPAESKPAESKAEPKPAATKPAEAKPSGSSGGSGGGSGTSSSS
jgi:putative FmdB family regulatory protein